MTTKMPHWLETHLIQTGTMSADHTTKHARHRRCPSCGLFTLVGLDEYPKRVAVDPLPTTTPGELFALLTGRHTYALDGHELYERTAGRLEHRRADDTPVYATHQCHSPPLPINTKFMPPKPVDLDGPAPF